MIHENSRFAYHTCNKATRRRIVFDIYKETGLPLTDREVKDKLNLPDMNCVRPRITELIEDGDLIECLEKTKDYITGKTVRMVRVAHKIERQLTLAI